MKKIFREIGETVKLILIAVAVGLFLKNHVVAAAYVPTGSMETTIMAGSRVIVNRLAYIQSKPERGDIVCFLYPDDGETIYIKRVMGLEGETIQGIDGTVYIDGVALEADYTDIVFHNDFGPFEIPQGCYFMMGDNRNKSFDSRYWENAYVRKKDILGQAVFEFYPTVKLLNSTKGCQICNH